MINASKKIELVANVSIIAVALLLSAVIVNDYFYKYSPGSIAGASAVYESGIGSKISLPNADWAKNGQTLILALSNTCHFCSESAPFYKRLASNHTSTKLIAALPQTVDKGEKYLNELGVDVDEVRQTSLDSVGVGGTPTLLLIDNTGTVKDIWVGRLPAEQEAQVLKRLN